MSKQDEIITAANSLFSVYGYRKSSMDEIAKQAGVTKKTVYSYFRDKESLLGALIKNELSKMGQIILANSTDEDFFQGVNKVLFELLKYKKESELLTALAREVDQYGINSSQQSVKAFDDAVIDFIKSRLEWAIDHDYIKDCDIELCAFVIYKIYIAVMFEWNGELDEAKVTENVTRILKDGLFN